MAALFVAPVAMAASFEIVDGQTVTTQQTLNNNETGVIQSGGSLDTGADTAIDAPGANVTITTDGSITTTGGVAYGIQSSGDNATISNSGSIGTTGLTAYGIRATGANTTITNSGNISTTQDSAYGISGEGANTTITNSGSISTTGVDGVGLNAFGADATISNSGSISTTGLSASGIYSDAESATISNSGSISTTGLSASGIYAYGANATVTNSGSISTTGSSAYGVLSNADYATITNSGSISTTGSNARGIESYGNYATIINSGTIITTGSSADGIRTEGPDTITNSGTIIGSGDDTNGINATGDDSTVTNSGTVRITGANGIGIRSGANNTTINNSGLVSATGAGSYAIYGSGVKDQTLNILPGSRIQGAIDLGDGSDTVNIYGTHGSGVMTFANTETINVHAPNAVLVGGDTVITVEPTGESSRGVVLNTLTTGIHNVVSQRMQSPPPAAPVKVAALELSPGMLYQERAPYAWGQVFGSKGSRDADGQMLALDTQLLGLVGGYERDWRSGRIGIMVGAAGSSADTDTLKQDSNTFFAGLYGQAFLGWANLGASLIVGGESQKQKRTVLDTVNGYETARSDTNGLFVSPSLTLSRAYTVNSTNELRPSMTLSYSVARYDGYTESGTTSANMTVDSRTVEAVSARLQGEWVNTTDAGEVSVRLGIQSRSTDGSAIKMNLAGSSLRFDAMGDTHAVGGYLGFGANLNIGKQLHLLADVEAGRLSGGEEQLAGQLTLQYPF
ncbi:MAG: autotransporter domain-containing protein [Pseudomonadota bacterium]